MHTHTNTFIKTQSPTQQIPNLKTQVQRWCTVGAAACDSIAEQRLEQSCIKERRDEELWCVN